MPLPQRELERRQQEEQRREAARREEAERQQAALEQQRRGPAPCPSEVRSAARKWSYTTFMAVRAPSPPPFFAKGLPCAVPTVRTGQAAF